MGQLILVLGGARSGKSTFAQNLAREIGGNDVLYVATAQAGDEEMRQRIQQHRRGRPRGWDTLEAYRDVAQAIMDEGDRSGAILIDCLTLLVSNRLIEFPDPLAPEAEEAAMDEVKAISACAERLTGATIIVSNEVGMGLVPPYALGRVYRDVLGKANQVLAAQADVVYLLLAGLPMRLKGE